MITRFFNVLSDIDEMCSDGFLRKLLGDSPNVEYICIDIYIWFWETIHHRKND